MYQNIKNFLSDIRDRQRVNIALTKGALMMQKRNIDLRNPSTWEFSGFSQNGEDGILDILRSNLLKNNRYFIEIGSADGIENNSAWLIVAEKYHGLMIDGNARLVSRANRVISPFSIGVKSHAIFVNKETVPVIKNLALHLDPDVFSLDIDGNDYYIAREILNCGIRPKIFVVEYNSAFGPDLSLTIEYESTFFFEKAHKTHLYYGVSISGWKNFFSEFGYHFVTVDQNGVNGFFVDPKYFSKEFLDRIQGLSFAENQYQYLKFKLSSGDQFKLISDQKFISI